MDKAVNWQLTLRSAEHYARYSRFMLEPWVPVLLECVNLKRGERVLDVACGTGFVTRQAIRVVGASGRVDGIDINEGMLAVAQATTGDPVALNIRWYLADVCELPFRNGRFDAALCQQGLQFFPDGIGALREIQRTLKVGGRIGLSVWGSLEENPYFRAINDVISRHMGADTAARLRRPYALSEADKVHALLKGAGYRDVSIHKARTTVCTPPARDFIPNHLYAMPFAGEIAALSDAARSDLLEDLLKTLNPYVQDNGMQLPGTVLVAAACR